MMHWAVAKLTTFRLRDVVGGIKWIKEALGPNHSGDPAQKIICRIADQGREVMSAPGYGTRVWMLVADGLVVVRPKG